MRRTLPIMLAIGISATIMLAGHSHAETINTGADVKPNTRSGAYLFSQQMQETLYRLGVEQDLRLGLQTGCKSQFNVMPVALIVLSPIELSDGKPHPTKGTWLVRYTLNRCGDSKVYNALFAVTDEGSAPKYRAYYPGSTNAHPVLVKDTMVAATSNAIVRSGLKDCKSADVLDMRVTEQPHNVVSGEKEFKGVWVETWTFKTCGQNTDVPITFTPDIGGGGTSYTMKLR